MKLILSLITGLFVASPVLASNAKPSLEVIAMIEAILVEMECQMDPDDIEVDDGGYELDDVMCKGGHQFDIKMDGDLSVTGKRAE